ncbi:NADP-dependent 3-hydroxy acid dehydrogenase YdfG [Bradyrhizobium sp. Gha]|nr:NADP-dependent 3-hydroxy acid dehydrogenase YdfG [Bradyrhizobium sp. Gha]
MPFSDYRTALVTGASSGIGLAVVERLAREGLKVHAVARSADALRALARRVGCISHAIDVRDIAAVTKLAQGIEADVLVNCAGVDRPKKFLQADPEDIDLLVDVNLRAILHLCRLLVPGMAERDRDHVVNITSIAGAYNFAGNSSYHATKAAVSMLTSQLRCRCGPDAQSEVGMSHIGRLPIGLGVDHDRSQPETPARPLDA